MSSQLAKMYLRGSLYTKIMKNFTPEQKTEIEEIMDTALNEPLLQQCRYQFKKALSMTIRNEYSGRHGDEVAEQDYMIALMRAAVAAKHGWGGNEPATEALQNPIQRKKWFQTWAFNYLRQILRENKIPAVKSAEKITLGADAAALHLLSETVADIIEKEKDVENRRYLRSVWDRLVVKDTEDGYFMCFDIMLFPPELSVEIEQLKVLYLKTRQGEFIKLEDLVNVEVLAAGVAIKRVGSDTDVEVTKKKTTLIRETSFNGKDDDSDEGRRDMLEAQAMPKSDPTANVVDEEDVLGKLKRSIPTNTQRVLDIYVEDTRPEDYIEKYGDGTPKLAHIAEYLDISTKEVKSHLQTIRHHCLSLGIGR